MCAGDSRVQGRVLSGRRSAAGDGIVNGGDTVRMGVAGTDLLVGAIDDGLPGLGVPEPCHDRIDVGEIRFESHVVPVGLQDVVESSPET